MPIFWTDGDNITAMTHMIPHGPHMVRLGAVYTPPKYRGKGYGKALVAQACVLALQQDKALGLNADIMHPFTNQMYQSLGFVQRNTCTDYRFTL